MSLSNEVGAGLDGLSQLRAFNGFGAKARHSWWLWTSTLWK